MTDPLRKPEHDRRPAEGRRVFAADLLVGVAVSLLVLGATVALLLAFSTPWGYSMLRRVR
jgi:hypothetical protein